MIRRFRCWLQYQLERFLLGGFLARLVVLALVVVLISVVAGTVIYEFDPDGEQEGYLPSIWWAFLRLTDPGYLGDDVGLLRRAVSTVVTVSGYVVFMGALIAVMTQWLNQRFRRLEMGLTPVVLRRHVVVLGWTSQTPEVVVELSASTGRLKRFLRQSGARHLQVAILVAELEPKHEAVLRQRLGSRFHRNDLVLRSGSPLDHVGLLRVDAVNAAAIVIPGEDVPDAQGAASADARLVKTLLTLGQGLTAETAPLVVGAIQDPRKLAVAEAAYPEGRAELIAVEAVVGRVLAQCVRQPGLTHLLDEVTSLSWGNEIYVREFPELVGRRFSELRRWFSTAMILGLVRDRNGVHQPILVPEEDLEVLPGDRLVLLAEEYEVAPSPELVAERTGQQAGEFPVPVPAGGRRLLVLGWSHLVPSLFRELAGYGDEHREIDVVSTVHTDKRIRKVIQAGVVTGPLTVRHHEADFTVPADLERFDLASYDTIILLGSDRLGTAEDMDARTLLGYHLVRVALAKAERRPHLVVELRDAGNAGYFVGVGCDVVASGLLISHLLARIALRRELGAVFDVLFGSQGPEFAFTDPARYGLIGREIAMAEIASTVAWYGEVALGVRIASAGGKLSLNPDRKQRFCFRAEDRVVVLTRGVSIR